MTRKILDVLDNAVDCPWWEFDGEEGYCMKSSGTACNGRDFPAACPLEDYEE